MEDLEFEFLDLSGLHENELRSLRNLLSPSNSYTPKDLEIEHHLGNSYGLEFFHTHSDPSSPLCIEEQSQTDSNVSIFQTGKSDQEVFYPHANSTAKDEPQSSEALSQRCPVEFEVRHAVSRRYEAQTVSEEPVGEDVVTVDGDLNASHSEPPKTWASLFKNGASQASSDAYSVSVQDFSHLSETLQPENRSNESLVKVLASLHLDDHSVWYLPRGLINRGNWCYVNSVLQALVGCAPFHNLFRSLPWEAHAETQVKSGTPMLDSMIQLLYEFDLMPRRRSSRSLPRVVDPAPTFEPSCVYRALLDVHHDIFNVEGRQEDAEEFLSCLLNSLHEEMLSILNEGDSKSPGLAQGLNGSEDYADESDDKEWQVQGPRKKSCITRVTETSSSLISQIFQGQIRSTVHRTAEQTTATLQPFFTLQLDIQGDSIDSVPGALSSLVARETLDHANEKQIETKVSRQMAFESLPRILILHLKRFLYDKNGGCQKLTKEVKFSIDLEIGRELLSVNIRNRFPQKQRQYKLFAVVCHDGKESSKGHYISEVFHPGYQGWLRYDDSLVHAISESELLHHKSPCVPYLLMYRRVDTIGLK
ncbi:unnamed protein product [Darwinula stevensoni]|uniref:Ubiquitin carboxyl-terminal hydrolase n=1 Tax=Darwinula stevensoni TaxID=69355 RepID=A0A7R8X7Z5_9CRUS|nr:unnamed protein product [Darwinula stevensoni]CAG0888269.1 unnamed protein product [Darwinula stevensoni]